MNFCESKKTLRIFFYLQANLQPTIDDYFEDLNGENDEDALLASTLDNVENAIIPEKRPKWE